MESVLDLFITGVYMDIYDIKTFLLARVAKVVVSLDVSSRLPALNNLILDLNSYEPKGTVICWLDGPCNLGEELAFFKDAGVKYAVRVPLNALKLTCVYTTLASHLELLNPYGKFLWMRDRD